MNPEVDAYSARSERWPAELSELRAVLLATVSAIVAFGQLEPGDPADLVVDGDHESDLSMGRGRALGGSGARRGLG